ncbi:MAG TPA: hypothetical protein VE553_09110 [Candidatus Binatia bacterium]|jgi:hypothetical protein|nr:hypothetical protein [Candidatus Binatia bacterium]
MEIAVRDRDEVWTSDGYKLGVARALHFRPPQEVSPEEQLYAAYLKVVNYELGDELFIPTGFLASRDATTNRVALTVPAKFVAHRTWSRAPDFVAKRLGREVRLDELEEEGEA